MWYVEKWIAAWGLNAASFINLSGDPNWDGRVPEADYLAIIRDYSRVIALGAGVSKHLRRAGIQHLKMPHPSGANLQMNDKQWVAEQVQLAKEYLND